MRSSQRRRCTLLDVMALIAATAIGFSLARTYSLEVLINDFKHYPFLPEILLTSWTYILRRAPGPGNVVDRPVRLEPASSPPRFASVGSPAGICRRRGCYTGRRDPAGRLLDLDSPDARESLLYHSCTLRCLGHDGLVPWSGERRNGLQYCLLCLVGTRNQHGRRCSLAAPGCKRTLAIRDRLARPSRSRPGGLLDWNHPLLVLVGLPHTLLRRYDAPITRQASRTDAQRIPADEHSHPGSDHGRPECFVAVEAAVAPQAFQFSLARSCRFFGRAQ